VTCVALASQIEENIRKHSKLIVAFDIASMDMRMSTNANRGRSNMNGVLCAAALAAGTAPALATDVGVSVSIGQPGFYGRLDIGGYPQPQVI